MSPPIQLGLSSCKSDGDMTCRATILSLKLGAKRSICTSILSVMQVMEKKGLLKHTTRRTAHVYSPAVNKKKIIQPFMHKILTEVFGGKPSVMMQALLKETSISNDEMAQIQKMLKDVNTTQSEKYRKGEEK